VGARVTETGVLRGVCAAGAGAFTVLTSVAMAVYPGGTWREPTLRGHSLWGNFLCDLFHRRALNGQDNALGAGLSTAGAIAMVPAMGAFFALVARLESPPSRAGRVARIAGGVGCACAVFVPLTPSDRWPAGHTAAVLVTSVPALAGLCAAAWVSARVARRRRAWWLSALAWTALVTSALDALAYAALHATGTRAFDPVMPGAQRIATVALLGWIAAVLRAGGGEASSA
jgi:hypothetical protein